jgi:predicted nuclease of restriction endonuclease-like (RecB) superfamily
VVEQLATKLTEQYGRGYTKRSLYQYVQFYRLFPEIVQTASAQSSPTLSWSHYSELLRVGDPEARSWYEREALEQGWAVKTLRRNINTQYYHRLLMTSDAHKAEVEQEMRDNTSDYQADRLEFVKNPVIAEFLGFSPDASVRESELEGAIIANLQQFLLELGKGYAFVARQQHIHTDAGDFFIDLVFYNIILKCYVLIDLKVGQITHQDVGQMDMYVRMYDELRRGEDDNPTLGIVLCSETSRDIARYSVLSGSEQLFASKYKLYLPTEDQLRAEIETQKEVFRLQHGDDV